MANKNGFRTYRELRVSFEQTLTAKKRDHHAIEKLERDVIVTLWTHETMGERYLVIQAFNQLADYVFKCEISRILWNSAYWLYRSGLTITPTKCWIVAELLSGQTWHEFIESTIPKDVEARKLIYVPDSWEEMVDLFIIHSNYDSLTEWETLVDKVGIHKALELPARDIILMKQLNPRPQYSGGVQLAVMA